PPGEQPWPEQVARDGLGLGLVDDAAPQQVAVVRGERIHLLALGVEGEGEVLAVLDPVVAVEPSLEICCLTFQLFRELDVLPDETRKASTAHLRVVRVSLQLAGRPREAGEPSVAVRDRVPGVLPALVL